MVLNLVLFFSSLLSTTRAIVIPQNSTLLTQQQSSYGNQRCDRAAAMECEVEYRLCKDNNIANDSSVNCECDFQLYGVCIRNAQCEFASREDPFITNHDMYFRQCIDGLVANNCPDPSFCYVSCTPHLEFNPNTDRVLPVNNYGLTFLQIRTCNAAINPSLLHDFGMTQMGTCSPSEIFTCPVWLPPSSYTLVTIPSSSSYISFDYCTFSNQTALCNGTSSSIFSSELASIGSFDTAVITSCSSDGNTTPAPQLCPRSDDV